MVAYPRLSADNPLPPRTVKPPAPVPVPHDPGCVLARHAPADRSKKRCDERPRLLARGRRSRAPDVQRAYRVRSRNRAWEGQLQLEDVQPPEGHREEDADVSAADREGDEPSGSNVRKIAQGECAVTHPKSADGFAPSRPSWYAAGNPDVNSSPSEPAA